MPLTLPPISRRRFLSAAIAGATAAVLPRSLFALDAKADPNYFVLFSDIHLHADRQFVHESTTGRNNMWANFQQLCGEALALPRRPAAVLINGDIAFHKGLANDYVTAIAAMQPLRQAGLPVHWALGNHDERTNLSNAAAVDDAIVPDVIDRRVLLLQSPRATLFMLDSLDVTDKAPGIVGTAQLSWLAAALDRHADRPAIVFVHHQPYLRKPETHDGNVQSWGDGTHLADYVRSQQSLDAAPANPPRPANDALLDSVPLLDVLLPRRQVKAYIFGHTHEYSHKIIQGMHLLNLPSTAWIFIKGQPLGWMDMQIEPTSAKFQLYCLDQNHPLQHDRLDLQWRA
jgi:3',5'-cyclic AMP phosphodiesterase CpdA